MIEGLHCRVFVGFNTQPPEGGWDNPLPMEEIKAGFNTQPPEGGWAL